MNARFAMPIVICKPIMGANSTNREAGMIFEYIAVVAGGRGPDVWDKEVTVSGEDMTIREALEKVESEITDSDAVVISIEQAD